MKSALFGSCPDLTINERIAAAMAWHGVHWQPECDWCRATTIQYRFEQRLFRLSCACPAEWSHRLTRGISKSFNFVLRASDSVSHSFHFVFDWIRFVMASADDNAGQLPADPGFLTPPSRVVTSGAAFCGISCRKGPGRLVSSYELIKLVEHERAPQWVLIQFTIQHNLAESLHGTLRVMRSQVDNMSSFNWI